MGHLSDLKQENFIHLFGQVPSGSQNTTYTGYMCSLDVFHFPLLRFWGIFQLVKVLNGNNTLAIPYVCKNL